MCRSEELHYGRADRDDVFCAAQMYSVQYNVSEQQLLGCGSQWLECEMDVAGRMCSHLLIWCLFWSFASHFSGTVYKTAWDQKGMKNCNVGILQTVAIPENTATLVKPMATLKPNWCSHLPRHRPAFHLACVVSLGHSEELIKQLNLVEGYVMIHCLTLLPRLIKNSLYSAWPWTHNSPAPTSWALQSQVHTTTFGLKLGFANEQIHIHQGVSVLGTWNPRFRTSIHAFLQSFISQAFS